MASLSDTRLHYTRIKTGNDNPLNNTIDSYFKTVDLLEICNAQKQFIKKTIKEYVLFCDNYIDLDHTLNYLAIVKEKKNLCSYNHEYYAIKKYLRFIHSDFVNDLPETRQKNYTPKELTEKDLEKALKLFESDLQMTTIFKLLSVSGLRAYECYSLTFEDFDLDNRTISVNRNNGKSTKNLMSIRKTYFNEKVRQLVQEYFDYCKLNGITRPFNQLQINSKLKGKDCIMIKDLPSYFYKNCNPSGNESRNPKSFSWMVCKVRNEQSLFVHFRFGN